MDISRAALSLCFGENIYANEVETIRTYINIIERQSQIISKQSYSALYTDLVRVDLKMKVPFN
jgi:hypothetical protein